MLGDCSTVVVTLLCSLGRYEFPLSNSRLSTRVSLLQNGPSATSHAEAVGSLDLSKLPAVSFAAMRLEIGSWQVILQACCLILPLASCLTLPLASCCSAPVCLLCCNPARQPSLVLSCCMLNLPDWCSSLQTPRMLSLLPAATPSACCHGKLLKLDRRTRLNCSGLTSPASESHPW